jgi:hypothetical protein
MVWDINKLQVLGLIDIENTDLKQTFIPACLSPDNYYLFYISNLKQLWVLNLMTL